MKDLVPKQPHEPISDRRRVLGFVLLLLAAFILLPEFHTSGDEKAEAVLIPEPVTPYAWPQGHDLSLASQSAQTVQVKDLAGAAHIVDWQQDYDPDSYEAMARDAEVEQDLTDSQVFTAGENTGPEPAFVVQVGTFEDLSNSEDLVQQLASAGYRSYQQHLGDYHLVFVGPQLRRQDAQQVVMSVKRDFKLNGLIKAFQ